MIRYSLIVLLTVISIPSHTQDLIQRVQSGINSIEKIDLVSKNNLAITLQERKSVFKNNRNKQVQKLFSIGNQRQSIPNDWKNAIRLTIDKEVLATLNRQASPILQLSIPVNESAAFELDLYRIEIHTTDFKVVTSASTTQKIKHQGIFYNGTIKNNPNSIVAVSIFEEKVDIFIQDNRGLYKVMPAQNDQYLLYNQKDKIIKKGFKCGTTGSKSQQFITKQAVQSHARNNTPYEVPIYVEADFTLYTAKNSNVNTVTTFINALMTQAIASYGSLGIPIRMSELKINTVADGYPSGAQDPALTAFANAVGTNFNGRLAHLLKGDDGGGVAYIDVLCDTAQPHGLTGIGVSNTVNPDASDVITFIHELGHNFGSPHTQGCFWNGNNTPIDGCVGVESHNDQPATCTRPNMDCPNGGGTIMSYCDVSDDVTCFVTNNWHPQVAAHVKGRYLAASCLYNTTSCEASVIITSATISGTTSAQTSIETQGMVVVNGTTIFSAPTVNLKPNFSVPHGQSFTANTTGCTGTNFNGQCDAPYPVTCGTSFSGNNANGLNNWTGYGSGNDYTGKEIVHIVTLKAATSMNLTLADLTADLDLIVVDGCTNPNLLIANPQRGTTAETVTIQNVTDVNRTYFVVVDGYQGASSSYTLDCLGSCGVPIDFSCAMAIQGNNSSGPQQWSTYGSSGVDAQGPEIIHRFQQPANSTTTINLTNMSKDLELIALDACSNTANVLDFSATDGNESVTITNNTNSVATRYIVVDGFGEDDRGTFTLSCSNNSTVNINQSAFKSRLQTKSKEYHEPTRLSIRPNPARNQFQISYQLAKQGEVQIELYNTDGKLAKTLFSNFKQPIGSYQQNIEASPLQEGVYYIVLTTSETRVTQKLVLF